MSCAAGFFRVFRNSLKGSRTREDEAGFLPVCGVGGWVCVCVWCVVCVCVCVCVWYGGCVCVWCV